VGRGNPDAKAAAELGKGAAQLVPQGRLPMFVGGRVGVRGIVDFDASFDVGPQR
jgi:hypothetical protein